MKPIAWLIATALIAGLLAGAAQPAHAGAFSKIKKASKTAKKGLFGRIEMRSGSLKALPKWSSVLAKMKRQKVVLRACAQSSAKCTTPATKAWKKGIDQARGLRGMKQLISVNKFFNRWPYKLDINNYKIRDYWASPEEFMRRSGDCEDYAIAKFYALMELGYANKGLRVVVIIDRIRGIGHAVLAVINPKGAFILDNVSNLIVDDVRLTHYIPQYSINETTRWAHIGRM